MQMTRTVSVMEPKTPEPWSVHMRGPVIPTWTSWGWEIECEGPEYDDLYDGLGPMLDRIQVRDRRWFVHRLAWNERAGRGVRVGEPMELAGPIEMISDEHGLCEIRALGGVLWQPDDWGK